VAMGADILVVGRAITEAPQPAEAARTLLGVPPQP
jgi:orotidine-5'-phosphate decarboxylase